MRWVQCNRARGVGKQLNQGEPHVVSVLKEAIGEGWVIECANNDCRWGRRRVGDRAALDPIRAPQATVELERGVKESARIMCLLGYTHFGDRAGHDFLIFLQNIFQPALGRTNPAFQARLGIVVAVGAADTDGVSDTNPQTVVNRPRFSVSGWRVVPPVAIISPRHAGRRDWWRGRPTIRRTLWQSNR